MGSRDVLLVSMPFKKKPFEGKVSLAIRQGGFFLFVSLPDWPVIFVIAPIAFAAFRYIRTTHTPFAMKYASKLNCSFARLMTNSTHTTNGIPSSFVLANGIVSSSSGQRLFVARSPLSKGSAFVRSYSNSRRGEVYLDSVYSFRFLSLKHTCFISSPKK